MNKRYTGGCLCGAVRYEIDHEPDKAGYCHCNDCKKVTGTAFGVSIEVNLKSIEVISGNLKKYTKISDNGYSITREFCAECGSPLFTTEENYPDSVWIKAGSLDEPDLIKPAKQIWTKRAVSWSKIDDDLLSFSKDD